jgi:putative transposase
MSSSFMILIIIDIENCCDYQFYLDNLGQVCGQHKVELHAYVLMTNHVHLLMTPKVGERPSQVMKGRVPNFLGK